MVIVCTNATVFCLFVCFFISFLSVFVFFFFSLFVLMQGCEIGYYIIILHLTYFRWGNFYHFFFSIIIKLISFCTLGLNILFLPRYNFRRFRLRCPLWLCYIIKTKKSVLLCICGLNVALHKLLLCIVYINSLYFVYTWTDIIQTSFVLPSFI